MNPRFPRAPWEQFREEMERLMNGFLDWMSEAAPSPSGWPSPPVNVWETPEAYMVEMELPGIQPDQLELSVLGKELSISGSREQSPSPGVTYHRRERPMGKFTRLVHLPGEVNPDKVTADLQNGVLTVTLPKAEAAKPKRIQVSVR